MRKITFPLTIIVLFAALISISHASSQNSLPYIQLVQNEQKNLNDAAQAIKQETGGRVLSAKTITKNGLRVHKIKVLLPSGKVQTFKVSSQ